MAKKKNASGPWPGQLRGKDKPPKQREPVLNPGEEQFERLVLDGPPVAPYQPDESYIPRIQVDIGSRNLDQDLSELNAARLRRCGAIGPGTYRGAPITPHPSPANPPHLPHLTFGHSHHIIELFDSEQGHGLRLQLLFRDYDLYLLGFRRQLVGEDWSKWYCCIGDLLLPPFLRSEDKSEKFQFSGDHTRSFPWGGRISLWLIFIYLGSYPDTLSINMLIEAFLGAVIFFSEALRDRFIGEEMVRRTKYNESPTELRGMVIDAVTMEQREMTNVQASKRINNWSNSSSVVLKTGLSCGVINFSAVDSKLKGHYSKLLGIHSFKELVGREAGSLSVLMRDDDFIRPSESVLKDVKAAKAIKEPGFRNGKGEEIKYVDDLYAQAPREMENNKDVANTIGRPLVPQSPGELRLHKDIAELNLPKTTEMSFPEDTDDLTNFEVSIQPDEGYYVGGKFVFTFEVPVAYPDEPPQINCKTKVYHPSIDLDGNVGLKILRQDWKPALSINNVLDHLNLLFTQLNDQETLNNKAAAVLRDNPEKFAKYVRRVMEKRSQTQVYGPEDCDLYLLLCYRTA